MTGYSFNVIKDPDAYLDYTIDWSDWLVSGDTISSSVWAIAGRDGALTTDANSNTTTTASIWLDGGTDTYKYFVTNSITTAAGREDDRTIQVTVRSK